MGKKHDELSKLEGVDFFRLAKKEPHPRVRMRLLALGHLRKRKEKMEAANMFQISLTSLRQWLLRFLKNGISGLQEENLHGRKKKLPIEKEEKFRQEVEALQEAREGGRIRGQDIQILLKEKFRVDYALPSVYDVLKRCGLRQLRTRSWMKTKGYFS
ncbi:MAG: winged helix-turn-helix domain-containing protein [Waddliaceae bacterium]